MKIFINSVIVINPFCNWNRHASYVPLPYCEPSVIALLWQTSRISTNYRSIINDSVMWFWFRLGLRNRFHYQINKHYLPDAVVEMHRSASEHCELSLKLALVAKRIHPKPASANVLLTSSDYINSHATPRTPSGRFGCPKEELVLGFSCWRWTPWPVHLRLGFQRVENVTCSHVKREA